jgi:SAM-dependent methyltransferase
VSVVALSASRTPRLVTGAEYVAQLSARRSDRQARADFQQQALRLLEPGGTLFDFGCGTGLDACCYAAHGVRVLAYDVDPDMRAYFAAYCAAQIAAGHIELQSGGYAQFLQRCHAARGEAQLITANFAPLNLVGDLPQLCAALHALAAPGAYLLASVLNPFFLGDARYRWWWRNLPRLVRTGHYSVPGAQAPIQRRTPARFAAACAPHFRLQAVLAGGVTGVASAAGQRARRWQLLTCRYLFLLFARSSVPQRDVEE